MNSPFPEEPYKNEHGTGESKETTLGILRSLKGGDQAAGLKTILLSVNFTLLHYEHMTTCLS